MIYTKKKFSSLKYFFSINRRSSRYQSLWKVISFSIITHGRTPFEPERPMRDSINWDWAADDKIVFCGRCMSKYVNYKLSKAFLTYITKGRILWYIIESQIELIWLDTWLFFKWLFTHSVCKCQLTRRLPGVGGGVENHPSPRFFWKNNANRSSG